TLIGNTIHSNSAQSGGGFYTASRFVGGTMMSCGSNILTNNVIYNNLANNAINDHGGGGLNLVSGTNTLTNNTLYNNSSDGNGGGIICSTSTTLTNNIFWQNKQGGSDAVAGADIANPYGTPTVTYCLTQKNSIYSTGTGIINNQDPLFVSTNSTTTDLKLQCGSPAMDAGTGIGAPTTDMLGVATMADKDMGAYESTCDIYAAPNPVATCKTIIRNNVSGNQWYHFADANGIVCSINPNGADLGTVTVVANIISPTTPYLRRSVSATSSNYPNSALISNNSGNPLDYTMRIYYLDTELADFNALTSSNSTYASLRIDWQTGGGDPCNYSNYTLAAIGNGTIPPINVTEGEFGRNNLGFYLGFNLNHFTIFTATTNNIVLPVKLLSFSGHADGDTDRLEWATATESNNKGFEVLYSGNGIDFKTLGFVDGAGDSNSEQHYTFMHQLAALEEATAEGGGYYKLKQVDTDRNFEYSNTIFISRPHHLGLRVFPNPTKDVVNIISTDKSQTTALYDITGLLIYRFDTIPDSIDIRTLAAGTYILRIGSNVRRIVKE
ncbi:MAG: hypothetical protein RI894_2479, partial [Bacteroidota bacterium]